MTRATSSTRTSAPPPPLPHNMAKLAIVGSWPENRDSIPWGEGDTEIWAFNEAPQKDWFQSWDACFQLHQEKVYASPQNWINKEHWTWLQQSHGKPIYMQDVDPRVPDSVRYPLEDVLSLIPYHYLRSSIAMALGLAIYQHINGIRTWDEIGLWGINLQSNTEYGYQAVNMAFWIGFAHGAGVPLKLHCWMSEFNQRIYGYEGEIQLDRQYYTARAQEHQPIVNATQKAYDKIRNQLDAYMLERKFDKVAKAIPELEQAAMNAGEQAGRLAEAERYRERTDDISRQEFEQSAARAQLEGENAKAAMHVAAGKAEYIWNAWRQTGNIQALNQLRTFLNEQAAHAFELGRRLGIHRENVEYLNEYDEAVLMLGGQRAVSQVIR